MWWDTLKIYGDKSTGMSICHDTDGNAYVAGYAKNGSSRDLVVIKYYGTNGAVDWDTTLSQGSWEGIYDYKIAVDNNSDVYVATKHIDDCWLLKFDGDDGGIVWNRTYNANWNEGWCDMALDNQGYIYVGGTIELGESDEAFVVAKYEVIDGEREWLREYGYVNETGCDAIDIDNAGNVYVGGTSRTGGQHTTVFKCRNIDGDSLWQYHYNGSSGCADIEVYRPTGESYITTWRGRGAGNNNVLTIAVKPDTADTIWTREYGGFGMDGGYELGITRNCVYVSGYTSADMLTLCYWRNLGSLQWDETYDSSKSYNIAVKKSRLKAYIVAAGNKANDWVTLMYSFNEDISNPNSGGPQDSKTQLVKFFSFEKLYPSPARDILNIRFNSPDKCKITIKLYDATGRLVKDIFDGNAKIGMNEISYEPKKLPDGIYFVQLVANSHGKSESYQITEKVIYQK